MQDLLSHYHSCPLPRARVLSSARSPALLFYLCLCLCFFLSRSRIDLRAFPHWWREGPSEDHLSSAPAICLPGI